MNTSHKFDTKSRLAYIVFIELFSFSFSIVTVIFFQVLGWDSFLPSQVVPLYKDYMHILENNFGFFFNLQNVVPFFFASVVVVAYFLYYYFGFDRNYEKDKSRFLRGVVNCPIFNFWISFSSWCIAAVIGVAVIPFVLPILNIVLETKMIVLLIIANTISVFIGLLIGILLYYASEFLNQKWILPRYFPDGGVLGVKGVTRLSMRMRFFILFIAVTVIPLLFFNLLAFAAEVIFREIAMFSAAFLFISFLIIRFLADAFRIPLTRMDECTRAIHDGDYSRIIPVISNDELGRLSNSLNIMSKGLAERDSIKETFGKIVDPAVRDHLLSGHINLGGEYYNASVLFTDIRDFTTISEQLPAARVVELLNRYFAEVTAAIIDEGGLVNKFIGDAVLALFGVPVNCDDHAARALRAARNLRERRERLNREFEREGLPLIRSGIGIHTGTLVAGNIGSEARMEFTAIGDTVNVASRLESGCKTTGKDLLFSEQTRAAANLSEGIIRVGEVKVKGRNEAVSIFTLK